MISVVVRSYNEGKHLKKLLPILQRQSIRNEVIVVDSESIDCTLKVAERYNATVVQVTDFTYGKGLNAGFSAAKSNFVCSLSAHCFPLNDNFCV